MDVTALQRRTLRVLMVAQVLGGLGQSGAAAGALLALDLTGSESLAGLPLATLVAGSSAAVAPVAALSRRAGRRPGLTAALATATLGAAAVVAAGAVRSFPLLLIAMFAFGAGNTAVMLARYAAADLSTPAQRGRAIGLVVFATTFGAVAGPNLLEPAGHVATTLGLPSLTGLFALSACAYALSAAVLFALLRPDPLRVAIAPEQAEAVPPRAPLRTLLAPPAAIVGLVTIVVANFVMVAVMAMAPVHMAMEGHDLRFVGFVISLHVAGMFAPAPLTGLLTDRLGPLPMAAAGAAMLVLAGVLAASNALAPGLLLLGVGWNAGLIAGSTLLASAVPAPQRPRAEGAGELGMGLAAASATAIAGPVMGVGGYATLAVAGAVAAAAVGPLLLALARRGAPDETVRAARMLA